MDYVKPNELMGEVLRAAKQKAGLRIRDMVVRGILAGVFLGYATSLALVILSQGLPPIVGAAFFPVGFVMLVLLGLELATGNFALLPVGLMAGEVRFKELLRNWGWVYLGNLIGSIFYGVLFYLAVTNFGTSNGGVLGELLRQTAQKKTMTYMAAGTSGWATALVKGILCNWMITVGTILAFASRSTLGKIAAMWLPVMTFFAHGYEHSVVNMYIVPAGMLFGAPISVSQWLLWSQLPVTIGNILSGTFFTGLAFYATYHVKRGSIQEQIMSLQEDSQAAFVQKASISSM